MFDFIDRFKDWVDSWNVDYMRWSPYTLAGSGILVLLSWIAFAVIGPSYGTDFTGGTEIHLGFQQPIPIAEVRSGLRELDLSDDSVQAVGGAESGEFVIRISDPLFGMEGLQEEVRQALAAKYGETWVQEMTGSAEVSARFVVRHGEPERETDEITRDLQGALPGARASASRDESTVIIDVPGLATRIQDRVASVFVGHPFEVLATDAVGPQVGADLRRQAFIALCATAMLILLYVAVRFDFEYGPGAIIAVIHDVSMTAGVFVLFRLDFNLETVGALLTILGWSINDTIVIFDRIRENKDRFRASDSVALINKSLNETLTRTIVTNFAVLLAILAFFFWGGAVLRDFGVAMLCGVLFGTYSTVFIACPLVLWFERIKPRVMGMLAVNDLEPEGALLGPGTPNEGDGGAPLTESEKRRRARADAEKRGSDPGAPG
jgi:preprotein translocase subunit SecF